MPYSLGKRFLSMILPEDASLLLVSEGLVCLGAEEHGGARKSRHTTAAA